MSDLEPIDTAAAKRARSEVLRERDPRARILFCAKK